MFLPLFFWLDFIIVATLFGPDIHIDMNMWKISFYAFPLFEMEKNGSVVERESCEHISSPPPFGINYCNHRWILRNNYIVL